MVWSPYDTDLWRPVIDKPRGYRSCTFINRIVLCVPFTAHYTPPQQFIFISPSFSIGLMDGGRYLLPAFPSGQATACHREN